MTNKRSAERPMPLMAPTDGDDGLPLLDVPGAATKTGFSTSWIYKRVADGTAPCRRVGRARAIRFKQTDLSAWFALADQKGAA